jgi:hypothetical protein
MQITEEPIPFEIYDQAHPERRPSFENPRGDNIYFFDAVAGAFEQRPNASHGREHMVRDLSGEVVLVSRRFVYFGDAMPEVPDDLDIVKRGPGFRCNFERSTIRRLIEWTDAQIGADGWNRSYGKANEDNL